MIDQRDGNHMLHAPEGLNKGRWNESAHSHVTTLTQARLALAGSDERQAAPSFEQIEAERRNANLLIRDFLGIDQRISRANEAHRKQETENLLQMGVDAGIQIDAEATKQPSEHETRSRGELLHFFEKLLQFSPEALGISELGKQELAYFRQILSDTSVTPSLVEVLEAYFRQIGEDVQTLSVQDNKPLDPARRGVEVPNWPAGKLDLADNRYVAAAAKAFWVVVLFLMFGVRPAYAATPPPEKPTPAAVALADTGKTGGVEGGTEPEVSPVLTDMVVTADALNIRSEASSGATVIGKLKAGDTVHPIGPAVDGWVPISLPNKQSGWVSEQFVEPAAGSAIAETVVSGTDGSVTTPPEVSDVPSAETGPSDELSGEAPVYKTIEHIRDFEGLSEETKQIRFAVETGQDISSYEVTAVMTVMHDLGLPTTFNSTVRIKDGTKTIIGVASDNEVLAQYFSSHRYTDEAMAYLRGVVLGSAKELTAGRTDLKIDDTWEVDAFVSQTLGDQSSPENDLRDLFIRVEQSDSLYSAVMRRLLEVKNSQVDFKESAEQGTLKGFGEDLFIVAEEFKTTINGVKVPFNRISVLYIDRENRRLFLANIRPEFKEATIEYLLSGKQEAAGFAMSLVPDALSGVGFPLGFMGNSSDTLIPSQSDSERVQAIISKNIAQGQALFAGKPYVEIRD